MDNQNQLLPSFKGMCLFQYMYYSGEYNKIDVALRTLIYFIESIEDEKAMKQFHPNVQKILPTLFSTFTNEEVDAHGRV